MNGDPNVLKGVVFFRVFLQQFVCLFSDDNRMRKVVMNCDTVLTETRIFLQFRVEMTKPCECECVNEALRQSIVLVNYFELHHSVVSLKSQN